MTEPQLNFPKKIDLEESVSWELTIEPFDVDDKEGAGICYCYKLKGYDEGEISDIQSYLNFKTYSGRRTYFFILEKNGNGECLTNGDDGTISLSDDVINYKNLQVFMRKYIEYYRMLPECFQKPVQKCLEFSIPLENQLDLMHSKFEMDMGIEGAAGRHFYNKFIKKNRRD